MEGRDRDREPGLSVILVPEGGGSSRTFRLTRGRLRLLRAGAAAVGMLVLGLIASWIVLAVRASHTAELEARLAELEADRETVEQLVATLAEVEGRYERLREMFGPDAAATGVWLPPPTAGRTPTSDSGGEATPSAWPLSERGFVTQNLLDDDSGVHPGLDIAVPADTYVRAAGSGTVAEVGEDPVYGKYVALDHGQGYSTLYAHASQTFVERGRPVRRGEVIALSGSTGRSTAPHLHFEILRDGEPVDPLTLVRPPA